MTPCPLHTITKEGFKVYPVSKNGREIFAVCIEDQHGKLLKSKTTTGEFKYTTRTVNKAITKAIEWVYENINKEK